MGKALRIYLLVNCLSLLFLIGFLIWVFNYLELKLVIGSYFYVIFLIYFIGINGLNAYAKKIGNGLINPVRTVDKAKYIGYARMVVFLGGIMCGLYIDQKYTYIALAAIPLDIIRIYIAHNAVSEVEETELLDDFEID
jgi:hypothetical protein